MIAWDPACGEDWTTVATVTYTVDENRDTVAIYRTAVRTSYRTVRALSLSASIDEYTPEPFERAQMRAENRAALRRRQGAVMDGERVRYWPVALPMGVMGPQVGRLRRVGYTAGVRDWTRGRHWDRRHRYGIK